MSVKRYASTLVRTISILSITMVVYLGIMVIKDPAVEADRPAEVAGTGSLSNLQTNYERWSESYSKGNPKGPVVPILWTRGLSSEASEAKGIAQLDLEKNVVSVRVKGLKDNDVRDVWFVNNVPGEGRSVVPEAGDEMVRVGQLEFDGEKAWLDAKIDNLADFELDMVVLARQDRQPGEAGVLYGTTSLFQKIFHYPQFRPAVSQSANNDFSLVSSANATGITPRGFFPDFDSRQLNRGRRLFFDETFDGNGRSCGTCHLENDNMALSLKSIAALPDDDPLFIVEQRRRRDGSRNALFNDFRMEKPELMRKLGLILENLNGFRELDGSFTTRVNMRAPSHVLSVRTTLAPPPAIAFDDGTLPVDPDDLVFQERTGWGGDGTPTGFNQEFFDSNGRELTGSLRDFVIGAITQHYPLTLERSASRRDANGRPRQPDFRFATESELDDIEAFMLSIGRQKENDDLNTIRLTDEVADRGRQNYMGFNVFDATPNDGRPPLNCNACHLNGGANTNPVFPFPAGVTPNHDLADLAANGGSIPSHNRSFGPQVERLADQAGDVIVQAGNHPSVVGNCSNNGFAEVPLLPGDSPAAPSEGCDANPFDNGTFFGFGDPFASQRAADNRFNAQPVFEAMDTPPFFHGHQINTIEGSVAFYATNRSLRNGDNLGPIVPLNGSQVINVARFMRVMGADFNAESGITLLRKAERLYYRSDRITNVKLAIAEVEDAIELLDPVDLHIEDAVPLLRHTQDLLSRARGGSTYWIARARRALQDVQRAMVVRGV